MSATRGERLPAGAIYVGATDEASLREVDERMERQRVAAEPEQPVVAVPEAVEEWRPDWRVHPGESLREAIAALGISEAAFARRINVSPEGHRSAARAEARSGRCWSGAVLARDADAVRPPSGARTGRHLHEGRGMTEQPVVAQPLRATLLRVEQRIRGLRINANFGGIESQVKVDVHNRAIEQALAQFIPEADLMHPGAALAVEAPIEPLRSFEANVRKYVEPSTAWKDDRETLIAYIVHDAGVRQAAALAVEAVRPETLREAYQQGFDDGRGAAARVRRDIEALLRVDPESDADEAYNAGVRNALIKLPR